MIAREASHGSHGGRRLLIVGEGALARLTKQNLAQQRRTTVLGPITMASTDADAATAELTAQVAAAPVDEVYISLDAARDMQRMQATIRACEVLGLPFAVPADPFRLVRARLDAAALAPDGYLHYVHGASKPVQRALKRAIDIVVALAALIVLSPLLLATALAIKLTSRGPVFFVQERVGFRGRPIHMLKFRSMVVDAEAIKAKLMAYNEQSGPVFKMQRDPRITPLGRFIRKYSIDELPQLWNVVRGDMSLVGPRPPLPSEVAKYEPWQRRRLSVIPGLTCIWQVSGRNSIGFEQWMLLDLRYIDHWSLASDFTLLAQTVPVVLTGRGAS